MEGIAAQRADKESSTPGDTWVFTLVTDPDDPHTPAQMLQTRMALNGD